MNLLQGWHSGKVSFQKLLLSRYLTWVTADVLEIETGEI